MFKLIAPKRGQDEYGSGEFGAPRGNHTHRGIDFAAAYGSELLSSVFGEVTKLGYPYADDLTFRYVEITDENSLRHRFFYVSPLVEVGEDVFVGGIIGKVQDIAGRYSDKHMINHFHYEVKGLQGEYIDPQNFL